MSGSQAHVLIDGCAGVKLNMSSLNISVQFTPQTNNTAVSAHVMGSARLNNIPDQSLTGKVVPYS